MAVIKNSELETLIKIEHLIIDDDREKLARDITKNGVCKWYDETITEKDIVDYWKLVEKFCAEKDKARIKSRQFNKDHAEYHRLSNNLHNACKQNNKKKIAYYTKKIEQYKRGR